MLDVPNFVVVALLALPVVVFVLYLMAQIRAEFKELAEEREEHYRQVDKFARSEDAWHELVREAKQ